MKPAAVAVLLACAWMALTVHYNYGGNWTALFCIGDRFPPPPELARSEHLYIFRNSSGYDGQFYHDLAHDPLLRHGTTSYIDAPRLRQRRILVPGLAWLLALGRQQWIDTAYFAVLLAFLGAGVYWMARYVVEQLGRSEWWSLLYLAVPATIISIDRMLMDLVLTSLFLGFVYYLRSGSLPRLWVIAAAACLTRETGLCILGGYTLYLLRHRKYRRAAVFATSAVPFLAWAVFVDGDTPAPGGRFLSGYPLSAFVGSLLHPQKYDRWPLVSVFDVIALIAFLVALVVAGRIAWRNPPLGWITVPFMVVALVLGNRADEYIDVYGYGRHFSPILVVVLLDAIARRSWLGFTLFGIVSSRAMLLAVWQAYRMLRAVVG